MRSERYQSVAQKPEDDGESVESEDPYTTISALGLSCRKQRRLIIAQWIILSVLLVAISGVVWEGQTMQGRCPYLSIDRPIPHHIYSPAEKAIQYKNLAFTPSIVPNLNTYQGPPTPENFAAWEDLYSFGISRIPMSEAAKLVNKTVPIADYPGEYVIQLDVFHQLHCLNMIRLKIWAGEGPEYQQDFGINKENLNINHIDHCIDSMRQSFMCSSDITPIPWKWDEETHRIIGLLDSLHTCRDFNAIREWAIEHEAKNFDTLTHIPDPLDDNL